MKTTFIYALCEPGTRTVRYIGKTDRLLKQRLKEHLKDSIKKKSHLGNWLRLLKSRLQKPEMIPLREVPTEQWKIAEERYIRLARGLGMNLTNASDGGEGNSGYKHTPEAIEKMRAHMNSKDNTGVNSPWFGHKHTPETRAEYSRKRTGVPMCLTHRLKARASKLGAKNHRFGTKASLETRAKMSASHCGKTHTEEAKAKMRGRKLSEEHRQKLSKAATARYNKT